MEGNGRFKMVGPVRFELTTSCTPCKRATRLRYGPNKRTVTKRDAGGGGKWFFRGLGPGFFSQWETEQTKNPFDEHSALSAASG